MPEEIEKPLPDRLRNYLKSHIKLRDVTYAELAEKIKRFGLIENEASIANKISRSAFSAEFFIGCLLALGVRHADLTYLEEGE